MPQRLRSFPTRLLGSASVPLTQIVAATLARVAQEARNVAGDGVGELAMTHPAEWGSARRWQARRLADGRVRTPTWRPSTPAAPRCWPPPPGTAARSGRSQAVLLVQTDCLAAV
nr:hypothetical protein GCM10020063_048610 [Dactylosporangium thailandense]